jgi:hypothetical protein
LCFIAVRYSDSSVNHVFGRIELMKMIVISAVARVPR